MAATPATTTPATTAPAPTGNWLIDSIQGIATVGTSILGSVATFQERILAAKLAAAQKTTLPQQAVTVPNANPNADGEAQVKLWAQYVAVTGGIIFVMLLVYKKVK